MRKTFLVFLVLWNVTLLADEPKNHPLITPYTGATLLERKDADFDSVSFPLEKVSYTKYQGKLLSLEGKISRLSYQNPKGRSPLEVFRNYQQALKKEGFEVVRIAEGDQVGFGHSLVEKLGISNSSFCYDPPTEKTYFQISKKKHLHIAIFSAGCKDRSDGAGKSVVWIVEGKPMDSGMAAINSVQMAKAIAEQGYVALYGIQFDFDKDEIKPESLPTLQQIAALLTSTPSLSLYVVGHTDLEGKLDYNLDLSNRRAVSVVNWLEREKKIAKGRLSPHGVGPLSPKSTNKTEEGKKLNRRVELVAR